MISAFFDRDTVLTFNPPLSGSEGVRIIDLLYDSNERKNYENYDYIRDIMANTEDGIGYIRIYDNHITQFTLYSYRGETRDIDKLNDRLEWFEGNGYRMLDGYSTIPDVNQAFDKLYESEDDFDWAKQITSKINLKPRTSVIGKRFTMDQKGYRKWEDGRIVTGWDGFYPIVGIKMWDSLECYVFKLSPYTIFVPVTEFDGGKLKESEEDFDWAKNAVNNYDGLKGKSWHIDFDTDEDFIEIQKWLFKQGFKWGEKGTKIEKTTGMKSIQSIWQDNVDNQTLTRSNRWPYKDSLGVSLRENLGKPIHIIWSDFVGRKNINENKMENPKSLLGLEFTLADEGSVGSFIVYTIDSVKEDFKGRPIIGVSWIHNGKTQSTTYNMQTVLNNLEKGIWKLYTGDVWNKLDG
jgi:hypothetical protein